jgi:hypothetical protein
MPVLQISIDEFMLGYLCVTTTPLDERCMRLTEVQILHNNFAHAGMQSALEEDHLAARKTFADSIKSATSRSFDHLSRLVDTGPRVRDSLVSILQY